MSPEQKGGGKPPEPKVTEVNLPPTQPEQRDRTGNPPSETRGNAQKK